MSDPVRGSVARRLWMLLTHAPSRRERRYILGMFDGQAVRCRDRRVWHHALNQCGGSHVRVR